MKNATQLNTVTKEGKLTLFYFYSKGVKMIYIDKPKLYGNDGWFSHMMTDGDLDELHSFAKLIGIKRYFFENKPRHYHYDVPRKYFNVAIDKGAILVSSKELIRKCKVV